MTTKQAQVIMVLMRARDVHTEDESLSHYAAIVHAIKVVVPDWLAKPAGHGIYMRACDAVETWLHPSTPHSVAYDRAIQDVRDAC